LLYKETWMRGHVKKGHIHRERVGEEGTSKENELGSFEGCHVKSDIVVQGEEGIEVDGNRNLHEIEVPHIEAKMVLEPSSQAKLFLVDCNSTNKDLAEEVAGLDIDI